MICVIVALTLVIGCSNNNESQNPYSPENTVQLLTESLKSGEYDLFEDIISKNGKEEIGKEDFEELKGIYEEPYRLENFEVITFANGEVLLVLLSPKDENNKVLIRKIIHVPEEYKQIFKTWE